MKRVLIAIAFFIVCAFTPILDQNTQGLVARWTFSEGGGNILINSAVNTAGTNAVNSGATWDVSPFGKCLKFVRTSSQYASCVKSPFNTASTLPLTLSAWVNCTSASFITVMADWNITVTGGWEFTINEFVAGKFGIIFTDKDGANYFGRRSNTTVNDGTWKHIVMTFNGSNANTGINLYINGVLDGMTNLTSGTGFPTAAANTDFRIGCRMLSSANNQFYDGKMALPMIWNRCLTHTEVWQLYVNQNQKIQ